MNVETIYYRNLSLAQKTGALPTYGQGFNYRIEIACSGGDLGSSRERLLAKVLSRLDHKSLGLDVDLGFEPTTTALAAWLMENLSEMKVASVRLLRGDGFSVAFIKDSPNQRPQAE